MRIGLLIYGSLETLSGGYLYDRKLVDSLRSAGDRVEIISLPWRSYAAHLTDNLRFRLPAGLDLLIQDELNHPSLLMANRGLHPYPIVSIVHHLRSSEKRPRWQNALYRRVELAYLRSVDGWIFNSETTQNVVYEHLGRMKPALVAYPPTDRFGVPVSERDITERARAEELRILFLGNVIQRKGLHILLGALQACEFPLTLDVVGSLASEPTYAARALRMVRDRGLSSRVTFHSALDSEPLVERLREAHVLAVPSSYEGFGIVYLEGMGFGLPAIGTRSGAAPEVITDGVDGFLIEAEDAVGLAGRLQILHERRDLLLQMSLAARQRYLRQPPWERTAARIRVFLQKQIAGFGKNTAL